MTLLQLLAVAGAVDAAFSVLFVWYWQRLHRWDR